MACDNGCGGPAYTRGPDGELVLFSVGGRLTPEGMQNVLALKELLEQEHNNINPDKGLAVKVSKHSNSGSCSFNVKLPVPSYSKGDYEAYGFTGLFFDESKRPLKLALERTWPNQSQYGLSIRSKRGDYQKKDGEWVLVSGDAGMPESIKPGSAEYTAFEGIVLAMSKEKPDKE